MLFTSDSVNKLAQDNKYIVAGREFYFVMYGASEIIYKLIDCWGKKSDFFKELHEYLIDFNGADK